VDSGGGWLRKLIRMTRGHRGRRIGLGLAFALVVGTAVGAVWAATPAPVASAQQDLVESDPAVVKARADLEASQQAAHEAEAKLEATTEQKAQVEADIVQHQQRIAELDQQRAALAQIRDTLLDHLRKRAVALYASGGDGAGAVDIFSGSALDGARRKQLGDAAARIDHDNAKKLEAARAQLGQAQDTLRAEQGDLQHQQTSLEGLLADLQQQQAAVDQRVAAANAALARARAIGALHAANDPIIGPNTLTADQMLAWFDAQGYHPRLADTSVAELAQMFLEEGAAEGVRGDFAFAQAIVETGGFSAAPDHNYSGLGWCDTCTRGTVFPTPRDGIRAQIQLLLNYADPNSRSANLHNPPSPFWWGPNAADAFDRYFAKGWAPTWRDMGHGNWATDPNYAGKVIGVYNAMVKFSQSG